MKRTYLLIFLTIIALAFMAVASTPASSSEWRKSYKGPGGDPNPGGESQSLSQPINYTPPKDPQEFSRPIDYPAVQEQSEWIPSGGRSVITPTAVSNMPSRANTLAPETRPTSLIEAPPCSDEGKCSKYAWDGNDPRQPTLGTKSRRQ